MLIYRFENDSGSGPFVKFSNLIKPRFNYHPNKKFVLFGEGFIDEGEIYSSNFYYGCGSLEDLLEYFKKCLRNDWFENPQYKLSIYEATHYNKHAELEYRFIKKTSKLIFREK